MPMMSEKQRRLFHAAKKSADIRKRRGLKKKTVDKMVAHDAGGKLPMRANMKAVNY